MSGGSLVGPEGFSPILEITSECLRLRSSVVQPINDRYNGPLDKSDVFNTKFPLVLLLGNHSSGKSSFVNWILKRTVQVSGVAPTDDSFTIIGPASEDIDRAGPALLGDPDLGFSSLRVFGSHLEHRTQLKLRSNTAIKDFFLVDTPGMIDSPKNTTSSDASGGMMDRGYDFEGVCRWYAERADVILLFFDPDKPGTTGETLQVLTNSLAGLDYKLHIILNKADQFNKINDFARAYGSLCWNLSKVIPRKDLPQIHTMCLPVVHSLAKTPITDGEENPIFLGISMKNLGFGAAPVAPVAASGNGPVDQGKFMTQGLLDLEAARFLVEAEVFNAPKRRVDNEISRLADSVQSLLMHAKILDDVVEHYQDAVFQQRLVLAGCALGFGALAALAGGLMLPSTSHTGSGPKIAATAHVGSSLSTSVRASVLTSAIGGVATGVIAAFQQRSLKIRRASMCSAQGLAASFTRLYARAIADKDVFTQNLWDSILPSLKRNVTPASLPRLPRIKPADVQLLERVLSDDVANLRRKAFTPARDVPEVSASFATSSLDQIFHESPASGALGTPSREGASSPVQEGRFSPSPSLERQTPVLLTPSKSLLRSSLSISAAVGRNTSAGTEIEEGEIVEGTSDD